MSLVWPDPGTISIKGLKELKSDNVPEAIKRYFSHERTLIRL